jgi:hypothetical protein
MRRIKQLLTMHFGADASTRAIGRELGIAPSTVREYLGRAAAAGIGWPLPANVTDESLVARLFVNDGMHAGARFRAEPDWPADCRSNEGQRQGFASFIAHLSASPVLKADQPATSAFQRQAPGSPLRRKHDRKRRADCSEVAAVIGASVVSAGTSRRWRRRLVRYVPPPISSVLLLYAHE